ncbi:MAG: glycosyltransferase [Deltaproteobacteria bacterium]|nr:glycosyltransferase [Deltaproteobacteria bacterium]
MAKANLAVVARSAAVSESPGAARSGRPRVAGKFFFHNGEKVFVRGVTYGPFAAGADGTPFPGPDQAARDFAAIRDLGANTLRTFTPPPRWLLDLAAEHGLWVLVGLAWTQHTCFLDAPEVVESNHRLVRDGVRGVAGHPAILAYLIGNEIPPDVVRWCGPGRVRDFLSALAQDVREIDPQALVSYANFPSTEYLDVDCVDFICFNVYLHREEAFRRYLSRLQNLAEDKPLVLTEFGIDSIREGAGRQAEVLAWQIRAAFEGGAAGTFVFSWTDEWFTGGSAIGDWAFGLVTRERTPKPAYYAVRDLYGGALPPPLAAPPKASVVICAYDAEATMEACLQSLLQLRYPNFEVIVVDDGSKDATAQIARRFPFRVIHQENRGLSTARNVGIGAATGEYVVFTDSDCVVDPDWLTYLIGAMVRHGWVAAGGPNLPPPEDLRVPACVAVAPGGPTHVLVNDDVAEHIPGCNMAFRRDALQAVQCFDPVFTAAGDDVDLCWRLQNRGLQIGFSPAAMVWHFRRNTVGAYLRQQRGYGKAEALLYFKHPYRFNMLGQSRWLGRIYGESPAGLLSRRPVIYYGAFGRGLFQTLYEPPSSLLSYLPFTLEWAAVSLFLGLCAMVSGRYVVPAFVPLAISWASAVALASSRRLDPRYDDWQSRSLLALLIYLGPLLRSYERYKWRLRGLADVEPMRFAEPRQRPQGWLATEFRLGYWNDAAMEKEGLIQGLMDFLLPRKYLIDVDRGWNDWDIEVHRGAFTRSEIAVAVENHGGNKRLLRVRCRQRLTGVAKLTLGACALLVVAGVLFSVREMVEFAIALGAVNLCLLLYKNYRLGQILHDVLEIVARQLNLFPPGKRA